MNRTPWYPPEIEPFRDGWYERKMEDMMLIDGLWENGQWKIRYELGPVTFLVNSQFAGKFEWRGLAEEP